MPTIRIPHQERQVAESFGVDAARYDRTRPHYPAELIARLVAASPGTDVLDVGAGTGIAARQLQAAGCTVLAVEADERMATFARAAGTPSEVGKFEDWDPAGRSFDLVTAGMAWHWVDPVAGTAKAAGVLRPGGRLAVFWNVGQPPPEAGAAMYEVQRRVVPSLPPVDPARPLVDGYSPFFTTAADAMRDSGAFGEPEQWRYDWDRTYTRDEYLDLLPTLGLHTRLPADRLAELLTGTGAVIDALGGSFTMRYSTVAVTCVSLGR